jgi:microcystin-dependent protein
MTQPVPIAQTNVSTAITCSTDKLIYTFSWTDFITNKATEPYINQLVNLQIVVEGKVTITETTSLKFTLPSGDQGLVVCPINTFNAFIKDPNGIYNVNVTTSGGNMIVVDPTIILPPFASGPPPPISPTATLVICITSLKIGPMPGISAPIINEYGSCYTLQMFKYPGGLRLDNIYFTTGTSPLQSPVTSVPSGSRVYIHWTMYTPDNFYNLNTITLVNETDPNMSYQITSTYGTGIVTLLDSYRNPMPITLTQSTSFILIADINAKNFYQTRSFIKVIQIPVIPLIVSGMILAYNNQTPPDGWLLCDGTHGTPDLRGRFLIGCASSQDNYTSPVPIALVKSIRPSTDVEGEYSHKLSIAEMPSHTHSIINQIAPNSQPRNLPNDGGWSFGGGVTDSAGSDQPHNNMPPFYVLTYIMKQ